MFFIIKLKRFNIKLKLGCVKWAGRSTTDAPPPPGLLWHKNKKLHFNTLCQIDAYCIKMTFNTIHGLFLYPEKLSFKFYL